MTVLCLVELDGTGAADASLRALTFARDVAGPGGQLAAVVFGEAGALAGGAQAGEAPAGEAPAGEALAAYGVTDAYVIEPGHDAWVTSSEPFVGLEFDSTTAGSFAKKN